MIRFTACWTKWIPCWSRSLFLARRPVNSSAKTCSAWCRRKYNTMQHERPRSAGISTVMNRVQGWSVAMDLTISLDEKQAAHLQRHACSRQLSPEQLARDLLGDALGHIAEEE